MHVLSEMRDAMAGAVTRLLLLLIACYRWAISPLLGPCCRFSPSCSCYAMESLKKHGLGKGMCKAAWRVLRCHPFSDGGYDPP